MSKLITIVLMLVLAQQGFSQIKGDQVFDGNILHTIRFNSDTEPNLYQLLKDEALDTYNRPYHSVNMEFDGESLDSVGIKVKGYSSSSSEQVPIKIDVNEYVDGQTFDGLKKFGLTNSYMDSYRQKDRVAYELFRRTGTASPRTSYVEVYINDEFIDLYLLVQQVDKTFMKENFADEGSLFKKGISINETIYGQEDIFFNIFQVSDEVKLENVNLRNYFKFLILNSVIEAKDNYPLNNFYAYYSDKEDLFHFIPWDYNFSMGSIFGSIETLSPLDEANTIWNNPSYKSLYLEIACELNDYLLDEVYIDSLVQNNVTTLLSNSQGATVADAVPFRAYLAERQQWLQEQLIAEGVMCVPLSYPLEIGDLVINEFVAKSDSIGGVQEPDGGTPDWIELYNNTNQDIVINHHFYLSDDVDFPKKWNFKTPVTIPANGYQIVWADRDVHQQGVHTNFKIEKSGGDLMLVYEDLTIIDEVSYEEQELNKGYARIPNGTGDFTIQDYTFNTNNGTSSAESVLDALKNISVYPNPTTQFINIISSELIESTKVFAANGNLLMQSKSGNHSIDIEHITSGIYFIQIQTANQNGMIRFVKQ